MSVAANLARVQARIARAAEAAGRDPASVRLLAASKTRSAEAIEQALAVGHTLFGESKAQELRDKANALAGRSLEWHFIGALQKNKVKYVVGRAAMVHSVDRFELAQALSDRCQSQGVPPIGVLLQVNLAGEVTKSGTTRAEALALARRIHALPGVALKGLMTLPPYSINPAKAAPWFIALRELAEEGREEGLPLQELSMGMSGDLEVAIAQGATIVRIGTAIFGRRFF